MDKEGSAIKVANEYTRQEHEYYINHKKPKNASYITSVFEYIQDECDVEFTQLSSTGKTSLIHLLQTRLEKRLEQDGLWKKK
jgi:malonyl CoA-acyl carrier protein transacylase